VLDLILILLGGKRLDRHDLLPLGSTGEDAIALYGDPLETAEGDSLPESVNAKRIRSNCRFKGFENQPS